MVKVAVARGKCELISEIATPYATLVIADLLGVPEEDRKVFMQGSPPPSIASCIIGRLHPCKTPIHEQIRFRNVRVVRRPLQGLREHGTLVKLSLAIRFSGGNGRTYRASACAECREFHPPHPRQCARD